MSVENKVNCVLLVDDNPATNFLNRKIITNTDLVNHIFIANNGIEALDFLGNKGVFSHEVHPKANIIFLDINMPKMGGFEFLEHYENLDKNLQKNIIVVFLTTSSWAKDKTRSDESNAIFEFIQKPLTEEKLREICDYYLKNIKV